MFGIRNLQLLVDGVSGLGNVVGDVLSDGRVSLSDLGSLMKLVPVLQSLVAVDYKKVIDELRDLDAHEVEVLRSSIAKSFDLPKELDTFELQVERIVDIALRLGLIFREIIELRRV